MFPLTFLLIRSGDRHQYLVRRSVFARVTDKLADCIPGTPPLTSRQQQRAAGGATGPAGYGAETYCRQGLMDRNGSDVLNR